MLCVCGCGGTLRRARYPSWQRRFFRGHNSCGACNWNWKGDDLGYAGIHRWLKNHHPKSGVCEQCGSEGKTDWAFRFPGERYTRDRGAFRELCRSCHWRFDGVRPSDEARRLAAEARRRQAREARLAEVAS